MNAREQALQRRVAFLEAQNTALMMVLDRAIQDIEVAESVACAFAWDLQTKLLNRENFDLDEITLHEIEWHMRDLDEATRGRRTATEIALEEANGIRRAADGSIISILPPEARK